MTRALTATLAFLVAFHLAGVVHAGAHLLTLRDWTYTNLGTPWNRYSIYCSLVALEALIATPLFGLATWFLFRAPCRRLRRPVFFGAWAGPLSYAMVWVTLGKPDTRWGYIVPVALSGLPWPIVLRATQLSASRESRDAADGL